MRVPSQRILSVACGLVMVMLFSADTLSDGSSQDWRSLIDDDSFAGWRQVGTADWRIDSGVLRVEGSEGSSFLVSDASFKDFHLRVDFRADDSTNSGVFLRCSDTEDITPFTCYEINIAATHTNPDNRTGGIVTLAPPVQVLPTSGQWNTFEIHAEGERIIVVLNGTPVAAVLNDQFSEGPLALQFREGAVRFRNVMIRVLPEKTQP